MPITPQKYDNPYEILPELPPSQSIQADKSQLFLSGQIVLKITSAKGKYPGKQFIKKFPISTSLQWLRKTCATLTGLNVDKIELMIGENVISGNS
jgi:hypothetical protein